MATAVNPQAAASISVESELARVAEQLRRVTVQVRSEGGHGSGVIWRSDGLIVTNAHVAGEAAPRVILSDGRAFAARLTACDRKHDLAALSIAATGLATAPVRDAISLSTGEVVLAVGNPMGGVGALAAGIVHAPASHRWVQADIRLAPGNSGGPLADARGRIIGINSMVVDGLALAVTSNAVEEFLAASNRPRLGVTLQAVRSPSSGTAASGLLVVELEPNSPAHLSGVMVGDILVAAGETRLRGAGDLATAVVAAAPAGWISLQCVRAGAPCECRVRFSRG